MANEKNVNEKVEASKVASDVIHSAQRSGITKFDPYAAARDSENDVVIDNEGVETIYSGTDTDLYVYTNPGKDRNGNMREWFNFRIGFGINIGNDEKGEPIVYPQMANFSPVSRDKGDFTFDLIKHIFKGAESHPVDIVKTVRNINDVETITYSLRLTHETPSGAKLKYDFKTVKASDKEVFENYIECLKSDGIIK